MSYKMTNFASVKRAIIKKVEGITFVSGQCSLQSFLVVKAK